MSVVVTKLDRIFEQVGLSDWFKKLLSGLEIDIILHSAMLVFSAHPYLGHMRLDGRS